MGIPGCEVIDIGGNNQMHLFADTRCANATATSELSVPLAAGQALRFDYRATLGSRIQFVLDGIPTNLRDQAALAEFRQCIPSYMAGTVVTAEFRTQTPGSGSCADVVPRELFVDNVEVVTDTRCQSAEGFVNGDFARNGVGWQEQNQSFYGAGVSVSYQTQGRITAVSGPFGRSSTSFSVNDDLPQTGVDAVTQTFCFPPGAAGHPWTFNITSRARGGGSCADVAPARLELAELKMVQAVCP